MKELLPALLCIIIMIYIIYSEFRNKRVERDLFVDTSISIIIMIVGLYSMYEYQFNFALRVVQAYVLLLALGIAYLVIVFVRNKQAKEEAKNVEEISNTENQEVDQTSEPQVEEEVEKEDD